MADIASLGGIVLPESLGLRRDHIVAARYRPDGYDARYDFLTLIYDAVHLPERHAVWLFCPKLANFRGVLASADIRLDGAPAAVSRVRRCGRHDIVELPAAAAVAELAVTIADWTARVPVHRQDRTTFAGRNVLVTVSRNNRLEWIADWARFHVREQGADAVLFYDNGSTEYGVAEIADALDDVAGLGVVRVLAADFPYGPAGLKPKRFDANFLQAALLNLSRVRFLSSARAVLNCDVDELVFRRGDARIFDAAVASRAGYVRVGGEWRFPATDGLARHTDHVLVGPEARTCPPKYCVVPAGRLAGRSWATHRVQAPFWQSQRTDDAFGFLHCHGISDFWKGRPSPLAEGAAHNDPVAAAVLARGLGAD